MSNENEIGSVGWIDITGDDAPALRTPCELARFAAARSAPTALVLARAEARRFALASGP